MSETSTNQDVSTIEYYCAPQVTWAVETEGIILINKHNGMVCLLNYPKAAVWDLISQRYSYNQTISLVSLICSLDRDVAERLVLESLEGWVKAGFLVKESNHG